MDTLNKLDVLKDSYPVETPGEWLRFTDENLFVAEQTISFEEPAWHTILNVSI